MEPEPATKRMRQGKRRQRFSQRELARADRAAPNRTIIVRPDGTIELLPSSKSESAHEQPKNDWDEVVKNAPNKERAS